MLEILAIALVLLWLYWIIDDFWLGLIMPLLLPFSLLAMLWAKLRGRAL